MPDRFDDYKGPCPDNQPSGEGPIRSKAELMQALHDIHKHQSRYHYWAGRLAKTDTRLFSDPTYSRII